MTDAQKSRLILDWKKIAGESIQVEKINGAFYAYGSEIACLRLANKFRHCGERAHADFSKNLNTWFFRLEIAA